MRFLNYMKVIFSFLIVFFSGAILSSKCVGQGFDYTENSVYVYNFIKYTSWPQKKADIVVGIVGNTQLETELKRLLSKKANNNLQISIKNIKADEATSVDVVIVALSAADQIKTVAKLTAFKPVLVITEKENMGRLGACISFFMDDDENYKTGYQLSIRNCKGRGLEMNKQIIDNAVLIR